MKLVCMLGKLYFKFKEKRRLGNIGTVKNIAVIKSGAIGDILMTTPFLRALRKHYTDAKITYITGEKFTDVLKGNKNIDKITAFDTKKLFESGFFEKYSYFKNLAKSLRGRFDMCFVLDKSYLAGLFAFWARIPVRIGFDRGGEGFANTINIKYMDVKHEIDYYLSLLGPINAEKNGKDIDFAITRYDENFADNFLKQNKIKKKDLVIGIAPAATKDPRIELSTRVWPKRNYIDMVKKLIDIYNTKVIFFGSKDDTETIDMICSGVGGTTYSSAGKTTVKQAAALIKKCKLFITHDCGLMHIAAATDMPVVSIFGPTDPRRKAPLNDGSVYLWKDTARCEKCEVYGRFPYCDKHVSTELIDVSDVLEQVDKIINSK